MKGVAGAFLLLTSAFFGCASMSEDMTKTAEERQALREFMRDNVMKNAREFREEQARQRSRICQGKRGC